MKGRTKLLKQREIREDNRTFNEIVDEVKQSVEVMAETYVPLLCTALKRERPLIAGAEIRLRVIKAVAKPNGPWKESTIRQWWPEWIKNPKLVEAGKKAVVVSQQSRRMNTLYSSTPRHEITQDDMDRDEEQQPVSSQPMWEYEDTHPKTELNPWVEIGEINRAIARLWTGLTGEKNMPHMEDDVRKDFIIPSRERFKDIANGSSKVERDFLFNWLTWLNICIKDRIDLLEKSDKTAYDR